ncbi:conserved exported hypothetical protein [Tenacibaculum maritimum]|nr:conserved exported hypothetical protein [Tenacibaculum maritimum]
MKMKKLLLLFVFFPFMASCQDKLDGKDEQSFKTSREVVEKKLNKDEKINLEKAMRVIALEAMRLKWEEPQKYDGKSFNRISLQMVDGLSYSSVIDLAEDILKDRNKKEVDEISKTIYSLTKQKSELLDIQYKLSLFEIDYVTINNENWFGEMLPKLSFGYKYIGKEDLKGSVAILINVLIKSTQEAVVLQSLEKGNNESVMKQGDMIEAQVILSEVKENNSDFWAKQKYPIENPNLADYDLELRVSVLSLTLSGKKIEMPEKSIQEIEAEIKNNQQKLEELKTAKGTLDELELTGK